MTVSEFRDKKLCYLCSFGDKVYKYAYKLSIGQWCKEDELELMITHSLLNIFLNYDERDLPDITDDYNDLTPEDFQDLMARIEQLL